MNPVFYVEFEHFEGGGLDLTPYENAEAAMQAMDAEEASESRYMVYNILICEENRLRRVYHRVFNPRSPNPMQMWQPVEPT